MIGEVYTMFTVPLYVANIKKFKHLHPQLINLIYKNFDIYKEQKVTDWNCDTFSTMNLFNLNDVEEFTELRDEIQKHVYYFAEQFNVFNKKIVPLSSWLNLSKPQCYQEWHVHEDSHFSYAYYLKVPPDSGKIVFASNEIFEMYSFSKFCEGGSNDYNSTNHFLFPNVGDLVIFRSNIKHMVLKNKSDEDRISISGNFCILNETS